MSSLREELEGGSAPACKLCAFLSDVDMDVEDPAEWKRELARPVTVVANIAVVRALKRRGIALSEASVRRHRMNHA